MSVKEVGESTLPLKKSCVACCEQIYQNARICPQCGQTQKYFKYRVVTMCLTWLGGLVTIISLLLGAISLHQWYQKNQEQKIAVAEIVDAANWLIETQNYQLAWTLFEQAAEINPSAKAVRTGQTQLGLRWLTDFSIEKDQIHQRLKDISVMLYRAIPDARPTVKATLLAHIGYIQVIRLVNQLPIVADVNATFELALSFDDKNVFANSMLARWLLLQRPITVSAIDKANALFITALEGSEHRPFVRKLQFNSLIGFTYGQNDEVESAALITLFSNAIAMMNNQEEKPTKLMRERLLKGYGHMTKGEHIDMLVNTLPAQEHLAVYRWLDDDFFVGREHMQYQMQFIEALIYEKLQEYDQTQVILKNLASKNLNKAMRKKVSLAVLRVNGLSDKKG